MRLEHAGIRSDTIGMRVFMRVWTTDCAFMQSGQAGTQSSTVQRGAMQHAGVLAHQWAWTGP